MSVTRLISPYNAVYRQREDEITYPSSRQDADDELRLCLGCIPSLGESLAKSQLDAGGVGVRIHDGRIAIANSHLQSESR